MLNYLYYAYPDWLLLLLIMMLLLLPTLILWFLVLVFPMEQTAPLPGQS